MMKNKPDIRLDGFTDAWEQRRLGELAQSYVGGGTPSTKNEKYWNGEIPWIQSSDLLLDDVHSVNYTKKISKKALENSAAKLIPAGSLAIVTRVGVGKLALVPFDYSTSQDFISFVTLKANPVYLQYVIYLLLNKVKHSLQGTSIKGVTNKELLSSVIKLPKYEEQTKIGLFFHSLDNLITLHQRELENYKLLKKGFLQKLFPSNGDTNPSIRFDGFTEAWELRELGKVGKTFTGLSGKTKDDFGHGDAKFVTYMNVFSNPVSNLEMIDSVEVDAKQNSVEHGDVFFTTSSETPEEVGMSSVWLGTEDNVYLNSFSFGYRPDKIFDAYYLAFMLRSPEIRKKFMFLAQGISRYNISKTKVMDMQVPVPRFEEQKLVGDFFKNIDNLITLHQRELDKYKELKKGFLQKMFV